MLAWATAAHAQVYPSKLVRLVTGSAAGGGADITARQIGPKLAEAFGQQVLVDNRPGVAGMLANEFVARTPADGYTLLLQPGGAAIHPQRPLACVGADWQQTQRLVA